MADPFLLSFEQSMELPETFVGHKIVNFARERYRRERNLADLPKGFVTPLDSYFNFVQRNGMLGLADELIRTVSPAQAETVINYRFNQARYDAKEMLCLRDAYNRITKPITMGACLVTYTGGESFVDHPIVEVDSIETFDGFSDSIVLLWQSVWSKKLLKTLAESPLARTCIREKNYGILVWCLETSEPKSGEMMDFFDESLAFENSKPDKKQLLGSKLSRYLDVILKRRI